MQQELILGMPWLIQENPIIDWAAQDCESEQTWSNPQLANHPSGYWRDYKRMESKVNCISAKAFKQAIRKRKLKRT